MYTRNDTDLSVVINMMMTTTVLNIPQCNDLVNLDEYYYDEAVTKTKCSRKSGEKTESNDFLNLIF